MKKFKLIAKEIRAIGYEDGPAVSVALHTITKLYKHDTKENAIEKLKEILAAPQDFIEHETLSKIARQLLEIEEDVPEEIRMTKQGVDFAVFGPQQIEESAMHQMYQASKLPISVVGALMPDAHSGYGLPIGGVLATKGAVIPYGVGVDIGCSMYLSVFSMPVKLLKSKQQFFIDAINTCTKFGSGGTWDRAGDHEIMDHELFKQIDLLKNLHGKAWHQLGTSGGGNHFVEFGIVSIENYDTQLKLPAGDYIGLLTHSGSRGLGAAVANHFTNIAISTRRLPNDVKNLAWLNLTEDAGEQYWLSMNLAGEYAKACHTMIHKKIAKAIGEKPICSVANHHNFAWKEMVNDEELIVHRKGATPAGKGVLGIIPGSMSTAGYMVKGKGETASINSASHGAGRKMSRSRAHESITHKQLNDELHKKGVTLLGGGLDEATFAYKDIDTVMQHQKALVDVVGKFMPKIVKMDGTPSQSWKQAKAKDGKFM
jgi:tRNA-splicing ligase RtcB (3'-phosphate/5'-hydroxy nucleic acid ligase)